MKRSLQLRLRDAPALIVVLGFGVGTISVIGNRVYVTRVVQDDALRRRCGFGPQVDVTWTEEIDGWERDAVLRRVESSTR